MFIAKVFRNFFNYFGTELPYYRSFFISAKTKKSLNNQLFIVYQVLFGGNVLTIKCETFQRQVELRFASI